jgi:uncharacterized protein (DUF1501 family)
MGTSFTRRQVLVGAGALGAATVVGACSHPGDSPSARSATTPSGPPLRAAADGILVLITLYGGNDGLNTVVPVGDPRYAERRGALAIDPAAAHDIGEGFALHPALVRSKALWDGGRLSVVHGVGFDGLDRSHFHCMDVWQAGREGDASSGWLGRWLDATSTDPMDAVVVGRRLPLLARGERRAAAVVPTGPFSLPGSAALRGLLADTAEAHDSAGLGALVRQSTADLLAVVDQMGPVLASTSPADTLAARLDTVGALIEADGPTRAYSVELDGFDTHANQPSTHANLLGQLDAALGGLLDRVGDRPVTTVVYSEFGRRVVPNASNGTDHGRAGVVLLAGNVRGGHHGEPPPLDRLVDGDLATTTDLTSVHGAVLEQVLGIEAVDVLDHPSRPLALV